MFVVLQQLYYETMIKIIGMLPDGPSLEVPDKVYDGIDSVFALLGWLMPYDLYEPLLTFIIALTVFRIAWAFFITLRK